MAVVSGQVSVGTSATLIASVGASPERGILVSSSAAVFVGGPGVTTATGFPLAADTATLIPLTGAADELSLYGVVSSGTATVSYIAG